MRNTKKTIILSGGGTLGSVTPLIALWQEMRQDKSLDFVWIGTRDGVEHDFVKNFYGIPYISIAWGKLRRYFSLRNFIDPIFIFLGFLQSLYYLLTLQAGVVVTAGSFVSVPLAYAAYLLRVPVIIHHMDLRVGLANKLIAGVATLINVTFEENTQHFPAHKVVSLGHPVRTEFDSVIAKSIFRLNEGLPTVLVLGGGTGAVQINQGIVRNLSELLEFCNIIHITGKGKALVYDVADTAGVYMQKEFLSDEMVDAYQQADLVITRAGLATLYELLYLNKNMLIIPIPANQQEDNAKFFIQHGYGQAAVEQEFLDNIVEVTKNSLHNTRSESIEGKITARKELGEQIRQMLT
jgi:UDP-N-acetylglucosamine--N-acetylmuramyl-(pentapeptide) pyrophosphoryl-undecaprenol N-acetylglucosamine transferase